MNYHGPAKWTGECVNGLANGPGQQVISFQHPIVEPVPVEVRYTGTFRDGKREGYWKMNYDNFYFEEGNYVDGRKHGRWTITRPRHEIPSARLEIEKYEHGEFARN